MSYYKTNLVFRFAPYDGMDNRGQHKYNKTMFLSTSVNHDAAASLYMLAKSIFDGKDNQVEVVLQCGNNATLTFEFKPDQNSQMTAYLVIRKNNEMIPFRFSTHPFQVQENGQMVTKIIQSGVGVLACTLKGYLTGIGADLHLSKLSEEELNN
jgi:hypothetical protein